MKTPPEYREAWALSNTLLDAMKAITATKRLAPTTVLMSVGMTLGRLTFHALRDEAELAELLETFRSVIAFGYECQKRASNAPNNRRD